MSSTRDEATLCVARKTDIASRQDIIFSLQLKKRRYGSLCFRADGTNKGCSYSVQIEIAIKPSTGECLREKKNIKL